MNLKKRYLSEMTNGWFVGNFEPAALKTSEFEVALKTYQAGEVEKKHHHKLATEITLIVSGEAEFNGFRCESGSIVTINPGESVIFAAIQDTTTVVVKTPSVASDKYED